MNERHSSQTERHTDPRLLTYDELAQRMGCTTRHLQGLVQKGRIPAMRLGRLVRFNWSAVLRALEEGR